MTQYFLTVPHDSAEETTMEDLDAATLSEMMTAVEECNTSLREAGAWVTAGGLQPPSTAVTVDATGGTAKRTEAPFVEADQYVGGFWIIEAPTDERALRWAEQISAALHSRIEVRALQEEPAQD